MLSFVTVHGHYIYIYMELAQFSLSLLICFEFGSRTGKVTSHGKN